MRVEAFCELSVLFYMNPKQLVPCVTASIITLVGVWVLKPASPYVSLNNSYSVLSYHSLMVRQHLAVVVILC